MNPGIHSGKMRFPAFLLLLRAALRIVGRKTAQCGIWGGATGEMHEFIRILYGSIRIVGEESKGGAVG
jgi:hypothetical protein